MPRRMLSGGPSGAPYYLALARGLRLTSTNLAHASMPRINAAIPFAFTARACAAHTRTHALLHLRTHCAGTHARCTWDRSSPRAAAAYRRALFTLRARYLCCLPAYCGFCHYHHHYTLHTPACHPPLLGSTCTDRLVAACAQLHALHTTHHIHTGLMRLPRRLLSLPRATFNLYSCHLITRTPLCCLRAAANLSACASPSPLPYHACLLARLAPPHLPSAACYHLPPLSPTPTPLCSSHLFAALRWRGNAAHPL